MATSDRLVYGPFGTHAEALRAVTNGRIPNVEKMDADRLKEEGYIPSANIAILPMRGPVSAAESAVEADRMARLFANHLCLNCQHKFSRHNVKTGKCPARNCECSSPKEVKL